MTQGEQIALDNGCTACHGTNGEGGVGPAWRGLYQSEVKLRGFGAMPKNSLNDAEVQAVVDFIKSLEK